MLEHLEPPMRRALELAWEAFCAGSFPVGAVVTGPDGLVVAEGRNRIGEADAPPGHVRATSLAHAEIDVLSQLPMGEYSQHVLYTSLEPCVLCRAASVMTHIGEVRFLADDPLCEGLDRMVELNDHAARRYPRMVGPAEGLAAEFAGILPLAVLLLFSRDGTTAAHYDEHSPRRMAAARQILEEELWPPRHLTVEGAIEHLAPLLTSRRS